MNPVTHLLASWSTSDLLRLRGRDRNLATWCGVLPDTDGFGLLLDAANHILGRADTFYYAEYHHALFHSALAAFAIPFLLGSFAVNRLRMFAVGVLSIHLHFLCDVVGSRGTASGDYWALPYLSPFSQGFTIEWTGQWSLNSFPNVAITLALMAFAFYRAISSAYSPVGLFSSNADRVFVETVRRRWRKYDSERRGPEA